MNTLREIRRTLKEAGFSYGDGIYFRAINDMFQNVEIRHLRVRKEYIINFGVMPLCAGILNLHQGCLLDLSDFHSLDFPEWCDGWSYLYGGKRRKQECEEAVIYSIRRYLLPFMGNCNSSKTAYDTYKKALFVKNEARLLWLRKRNEKDCAPRNDGYFDSCLLYLSLKNGNNDFARSALEARIAHEKKLSLEIQEEEACSAKLKRLKEGIAQCELLISYLENREYNEIQAILDKREKASLGFLQNSEWFA